MDSDLEYYYNDALRWTFGFDNPNKAAVIFVCLFPLSWLLWSLAWKIKSPWIRWVGILFASGLILANGFCLFKTYSRGGVVAAIVAGLYFFGKTACFDFDRPKSLRDGRICGATVLVIFLIALFLWMGLGARSMEPISNGDASVTHRLVLWGSALEMAVDNPWGFGIGRSGESYMQWYEPLEMSAGYRTMVNSYLTFLVEQGWLRSACCLLLLLWFWFWALPPRSQLPQWGIIVGLRATIVGFLISGLFSTVMEEPFLWIVPGASALTLIIWCFRLRVRPSPHQWVVASLWVGALLLCLYGSGYMLGRFDSVIHKCGWIDQLQTIVEIDKRGAATSPVWIVVPDEKILGNRYGKLLRQLVLQTGIGLKIQGETAQIPSDLPLLLVGDAVQRTPVSSRSPVVFLSPSITSDGQAVRWIKSCPDLSLVLPGIDEDGRASFWQNCADGTKMNPQAVSTLGGVGLRIDWAWSDVVEVVEGKSASLPGF